MHRARMQPILHYFYLSRFGRVSSVTSLRYAVGMRNARNSRVIVDVSRVHSRPIDFSYFIFTA